MALSFSEKRALQKSIFEQREILAKPDLTFKQKRAAQKIIFDARERLGSSLPTNPLQKYIDFLRGVIAGGHNTDAGDSLADRLLEAGEACLVDPLLDDLVAQATEAAFEIVSAPFAMA